MPTDADFCLASPVIIEASAVMLTATHHVTYSIIHYSSPSLVANPTLYTVRLSGILIAKSPADYCRLVIGADVTSAELHFADARIVATRTCRLRSVIRNCSFARLESAIRSLYARLLNDYFKVYEQLTITSSELIKSFF